MIPGNDEIVDARRERGQSGPWYKLTRCSICMRIIWSRPIALKEPVEAPEPRYEWILCKSCHEALLVEMRRSSIRSPVRQRIAIGLVAAERSPKAYPTSSPIHEEQDFQREFAWGIRLLVLFTLFHLVIFVILLTVPK